MSFCFPVRRPDGWHGTPAAETLPSVRRLYDQAAEILGYDLAQVCFEGPEQELDSTVISQPALFVTSLAALESLRLESPALWKLWATAGLSLGEYTAMVFAGVMDFEDALKVVQRRGEAMQAASDAVASGMVSILGLEPEKVEQLCDEARGEDEVLEIANRLCPGNIAISGHATACERAAELADSIGRHEGGSTGRGRAFHTELMRSAVDKLADALAEVPMQTPRIPVVSNVDARPHDDPEEIRQLLIQQVVSQVLGKTRCVTCWTKGPSTFTRLDRDACCEVCSGESIARCLATTCRLGCVILMRMAVR